MRRVLLPVALVWIATVAGCASPNEESWIGSGVDEVIRTQGAGADPQPPPESD